MRHIPAALLLAATALPAAALPPCDQARPEYSAPTPELMQRVELARAAPGADAHAAGLPHTASPDGSHDYVVLAPDTMRPGPWDTTIYVFDHRTHTAAWRLTFRDHASGGVRPRWLDDQRLSVEAWWGRIVNFDMILDTSTGQWTSVREVNHAREVEPCSDQTGTP